MHPTQGTGALVRVSLSLWHSTPTFMTQPTRTHALLAANQESMQILRYVNGQEYKPHHDYFHDAPHINPKTGG